MNLQNLMNGTDTLLKLQALGMVAVPTNCTAPRSRVSKALAAVAGFHRRSRTIVFETWERSRLGHRSTMEQVAAEVPLQAGLYGAGGRDRVVRIAQERRTNEEMRRLSREVGAKSADTISALAIEARDALRAFDVAIEGERVRWHGPSSLRDDAPKNLESILLEQRLAHELESAGVDGIESTYFGLLKVGDTERAQKIEAAARAFLLRVVDDGAHAEEGRKRARSGRVTDGASMSKAITLLARFEEERAARVPAELSNALALRDAFGELYSSLLGMSARHLSTEAFAQRYLNGSSTNDPYEIDASWPFRFSPPNAPLDPEPSSAPPMRLPRL